MKIKIISAINIFLAVIIFSVPIFVSAQALQGGIIDPKQPVDYYTLDRFWKTLVKVVDFALQLAALFVIIVIVWAGVLYLTSQGNPGTISKANGMLQNAAIGFFIAVAAWLIVRVVTTTLGVHSSLVPTEFKI